MERLPLYQAQYSHEELERIGLQTQHRSVSCRRLICAVAFCVAFFLSSLALLENEPSLPALLMEWLLSFKMLFGRRPDHGLSIIEPVWEGLKGGEHCLRYATRQYTARLSDIPAVQDYDMMRACRDTPVEIHGEVMYTDFCQDLGFNRGVWGFWIVDSNEPDCETRWGEFTDVGCLNGNAPARRIEARLENLRRGDDWQFMCVTTPADIDGRYFPTPTECFNQGRWGVYGTWDLRDNSCPPQTNATTNQRVTRG